MSTSLPRSLLLPLVIAVGLVVAWSRAPAARGDLVVPRRGAAVEGAIVRATEAEVLINRYFSRHPGVTNPDHLVRLRRAQVKRIERRPRPRVAFWQRLDAAERDPGALALAADHAATHGLEAEARYAAGLILDVDPEHAAALEHIGGPANHRRWCRGQPALDRGVRDLLATFITTEPRDERDDLHEKLRAQGFEPGRDAAERYARSAREATGLQVDLPVAWNAPAHPDARYTLFVPRSYDPVRTWPLLIGLHGGGVDGRAGDEVFGRGRWAMDFYRQLASQRGVIVACPNALAAPWSRAGNERLVRDLVEELTRRFHVDLDRIYLTGHSMGGFGTWALGPRMSDVFAALSPMAGGGGDLAALKKARTPIFIYHAADDYVSVDSDRRQAQGLLGTGHDFVYTELPSEGHGFPQSIRVALFDFLLPRRLQHKRKIAMPRSSFARKVSKEERRWLALAYEAESAPDLDEVFALLAQGGRSGRRAAEDLAERRPKNADARLGRLLEKQRVPFDARAYAARALGHYTTDKAQRALERAVKKPASKAQALITIEAARALARQGRAVACKPLSQGALRWGEFLENKRSRGEILFGDWERGVPVLQTVVEAWAAVAEPGSRTVELCAAVIDRVLAPATNVPKPRTLREEPMRRRKDLALAMAKALKAAHAEDARWEELLAAVSADPAIRRAVIAART